MKAVVISQKRLDELFASCLDKLQLSQIHVSNNVLRTEKDQRITEDMHRKFHYQVCKLKSDIEEI